MKTLATIGGTCLAILAASSPALRVQGATKAEQAQAAAKIVEDTLQQEARDGLPDRGEPLEPALDIAPGRGEKSNYQCDIGLLPYPVYPLHFLPPRKGIFTEHIDFPHQTTYKERRDGPFSFLCGTRGGRP